MLGKTEGGKAPPGVHSVRFMDMDPETKTFDNYPNPKASINLLLLNSETESPKITASVDIADDLWWWTRVLTGTQQPLYMDQYAQFNASYKLLQKCGGKEFVVLCSGKGYPDRPTPEQPVVARLRFSSILTRENGVPVAVKQVSEKYGESYRIKARFELAEEKYRYYWADLWFNMPEVHYNETGGTIWDSTTMWKVWKAFFREEEWKNLTLTPGQPPLPIIEQGLKSAAAAGQTGFGMIDSKGKLDWRSLEKAGIVAVGDPVEVIGSDADAPMPWDEVTK